MTRIRMAHPGLALAVVVAGALCQVAPARALPVLIPDFLGRRERKNGARYIFRERGSSRAPSRKMYLAPFFEALREVADDLPIVARLERLGH